MKKCYLADLTTVPEMLKWVKGAIEKVIKTFEFDESQLNKIEVSAEEALVNIVKHGYEDQAGEIEISVTQTTPLPGISIKIVDKAKEFNPCLFKTPHLSGQSLVEVPENGSVEKNSIESKNIESKRKNIEKMILEKKTPGGYGIALMLNMMDEVKYQRVKDSNVLLLIKYI